MDVSELCNRLQERFLHPRDKGWSPLLQRQIVCVVPVTQGYSQRQKPFIGPYIASSCRPLSTHCQPSKNPWSYSFSVPFGAAVLVVTLWGLFCNNKNVLARGHDKHQVTLNRDMRFPDHRRLDRSLQVTCTEGCFGARHGNLADSRHRDLATDLCGRDAEKQPATHCDSCARASVPNMRSRVLKLSRDDDAQRRISRSHTYWGGAGQ